MILVSGGAGYIGSHTLLSLAEAGYELLIVDNLSLGRREFVLAGELVELDLRDKEGLARLFADRRVEGIIHFAAHSQVGQSMADPALYFDNNITGGLNLFGLAAQAGAPVVLSSSCAVYGQPQSLPLREDHPRKPVSPYGFTKLVLERALEEYHRAYGLPYLSLRYFNAAGAEPQARLGEAHQPETHLIPLILQVAAGQRESVAIFGTDYPTPDGTCIRDYIHVLDLAQAHLLALAHLAGHSDGRALNLGLGRGFSVREVLAVCGQVTGRPIETKEAARRPGDPAELVADPTLAEQTLDWRPAYTDLAEIIATAWAWSRGKENL